MEKIRIIIINDQKLFRQCISSTIRKHTDIIVAGEAKQGIEYLNKVVSLKPDVVLMGVRMDITDIINTTQLSMEYHPQIKVIALIQNLEKVYLTELIKSGIKGILSNNLNIDEIALAIRTVNNNKQYYSGEILKIINIKSN
jgi:DNA-binding NarL/FixJ family response regulator